MAHQAKKISAKAKWRNRRKLFRDLSFFAAGFIFAVLMAAATYFNNHAEAGDEMSCKRTSLIARLHGGTIASGSVTIQYETPACFTNAGLSVSEAFRYSGNAVRVKYKSSTRKKSGETTPIVPF